MTIDRQPRLRELGIAAGLVAMFLFGLLYATTGYLTALIVGCGGGFFLLIASLLAGQTQERPR